MRWYHYLIILACLALSFGAGYFVRFWFSPLGCPMCICTDAQAIATVTTTNYNWIWIPFVLLSLVLTVEGGILAWGVYRIAKGK